MRSRNRGKFGRHRADSVVRPELKVSVNRLRRGVVGRCPRFVSFKEEVRGSNPLRATDRVTIGFYAIRFPYRTLLCCEGPFSDGLFSESAARAAVKGEAAPSPCQPFTTLQEQSATPGLSSM